MDIPQAPGVNQHRVQIPQIDRRQLRSENLLHSHIVGLRRRAWSLDVAPSLISSSNCGVYIAAAVGPVGRKPVAIVGVAENVGIFVPSQPA